MGLGELVLDDKLLGETGLGESLLGLYDSQKW